MKKKITVILSVALLLVIGCVMLIGCTPSKPGDYLTKWSEDKNISYTISSYEDEAYILNADSGEYVLAEGGRTTTQTTFIKYKDNLMYKTVEIYNYKNKDGKYFKNDIIRPVASGIVEKTKDGNFNVYNFELEAKKADANSKYVETNVWTAEQVSKDEILTNATYIQINSAFEYAVENAKSVAETFDKDYAKGKGGYYVANEKMGDLTARYKVKSGSLEFEALDSDDKIVEAEKYDFGSKIVVPSGGKDALTKYTETKSGVITKIDTVKNEKVYTIKVADKEYSVKKSVTGYGLLADCEVNDEVTVWLSKGMLGGYSIKEIIDID